MSLPKFTRKELYLSYLNGDTSVELPAPVTNEEHYLYELCMNKGQGGTGGVTSWNDLTDKPFDRTLEEDVIIINHETFSVEEGLITFPKFSLILGETYSIRWGTKFYTCVAQDLTDIIGGEAVGIGDVGAMVGGESSGEPFLIMTTDFDGGMARGMALDGSTTVKIYLVGKTYVYSKLDDRYINSNLVFVQLNPSNDSYESYTSVLSFTDIHWMITVEKRTVIPYTIINGNYTFFNLVSISSNFIRFNTINIASDGVGFINMDCNKSDMKWYPQNVRINISASIPSAEGVSF